MNKILFSLLLIPCFGFQMEAQNPGAGVIRGKIVDTSSRQSLGSATISLLNAKDSSILAEAEAEKNGQFEIKGIPEGQYRFVFGN